MSQNGIPIDTKLYKAAVDGRFEELERFATSLDLLVSSKQDTVLHIHLNSMGQRSAEFVQKVFNKCPQLIKQTNENGDTPLHFAARNNFPKMAALLIQLATTRDLESGREPTEEVRKMMRIVNKDKNTALHEAVRWNCVDVVEELLRVEDLEFKYGANSSGETPLYLAARYSSVDSLKAMLRAYKHKPVAYQGPNGKTVLHAALEFSVHYEVMVSAIIDHMGSLVNEADENGWTPLHYAVFKPDSSSSSSVMSKILENDTSSVYMKDNHWKRTPLHIAACLGNIGAMKIIVSRCFDCAELTDCRGWNVCHFASISKSPQALKLILGDRSLFHLGKCRDINGYIPIELYFFATYSTRSYSSELEEYVFICRLRDLPLDKIIKKKEEVAEWIEELGDGPFGKLIPWKSPEEKRKEMEDEIIPELEKAKESHLVAAALVATVTFAAAFALPGGYVSDENKSKNMKLGSPILSRNAAFRAFVITDGIALVLSTSSVFIHYIMVMLGYKQKYYWLVRSAFWFIIFAMGAMVVAFVTGTYAILAPDSFGVALLTCLIGLSFFLYVFYTVIRLTTKDLGDWDLETAPRYLCWDACGPLCSICFGCCLLIFLPIYGLPCIIYIAWKWNKTYTSPNLDRN